MIFFFFFGGVGVRGGANAPYRLHEKKKKWEARDVVPQKRKNPPAIGDPGIHELGMRI